MRKVILSLLFILSFICYSKAQIVSPTSAGQITTQYQTSPQNDIYIFCSVKNSNIGLLSASMSSNEIASFNWYKLNETSLQYIFFSAEQSVSTSTISNLANGLYKVEIQNENNTEVYQAWVLNNWYEVTASIDSCNCNFVKLKGKFSESPSTYIDISNGNILNINKNLNVKWDVNGSTISSILNPTISNPPAVNTTYNLTVFDKFGCSSSAYAEYISVVPKADFSANPTSGEAPLSVTFTNQSINADKYEWSFYRSKEELEKEFNNSGSVYDSIKNNSFSSNPQYIYEESGSYMVKLEVSKTTDNLTCFDQMIKDDYIHIDTSYVEAPNFFTPNGDGNNDSFLIKYTSMKRITISIFNRWGKMIFQTNNSDVGSYEDYGTQFAWDGKIGGSLASPGVYYYVVEGLGRDGKKHNKQGFFHLFREK